MSDRPQCYLDISIGGEPAGRIVIELFSDVVPRTCENFRCLCTGEKGKGKQGKLLYYKGCPMHRIIPKFVVQGGDIIKGDGHGGETIYGPYFDDENFKLGHDKPFLLSMANSGPNKNRSQFFITLTPQPSLNGKHVVFGEVIEGQDVVRAMEQEGTKKGTPKTQVIITDCGQIGGSSSSSGGCCNIL